MERNRRYAWIAAVCAWGPVGLFQPASAVPPVEAYGRLPFVQFVRIAPAGEHIALLAISGETRRLIIMTPQGKLVRGVGVGDAKIRDLQWAGDDHVLVTATATVNAQLDFGHSYELSAVSHVGLGSEKPWEVLAIP